MRKALVATGVVAVTGTIAVPAVLLSGSSSWEDEEEINQESQWQGLMPKLNSSKDIKNAYAENDCLKEKLQSINNWNGGNTSVTSESLNFQPSNGCLTVEYYKQTYKDNKWRGKFKFVWSLTGTGNNEKGLLTVVYAETRDTKLFVDSSFYILDKSSSNWSVSFSTSNSKEISSDELSKRLPKPGTLITEESKAEYWGFNPDLTKICAKGSCGKMNGAPTKSSISWKISKDDSETSEQPDIKELFSNFNDWFSNSFNDGANLASLINSSASKFKLIEKKET